MTTIGGTTIPFFFLKIRKGKDYHIFNSVDNKDYVINYSAFRILEMCDGIHTLEEIADMVNKDFGLTRTDSIDCVKVFLDEMHRLGMIASMKEKIDSKIDCPPPSTVFWDITRECNLRCTHCYNLDGRPLEKELSTEEIRRAIEEMSAFEVGEIAFSGGEPLMRKDFLEIASYAAGLGFKSVSVATNGTLIDSTIAERLKMANLNVQVSLDGDVAEIHDEMRGMKGAFDLAICGIKLLLKEGVNVSVCTTATKLNIDRIPSIIQQMHRLNVENYRVQIIMPMGRGKKNIERLYLTPSRIKSLVEFLESQKINISSYNFTLKPPPTDTVDFSNSGACGAGNSICSITPEGNVVPCTNFWGMNGENLHDHTFQWIWENSVLLNYFRNIRLNDIKGVCRNCKWLLLCHGGCKAENYANGDIFGSSRSCWVADEMRHIKNPDSMCKLDNIDRFLKISK